MTAAHLADGNVLIALTVSDHVHHDAAVEWFGRVEPDLATCPITEGALLRFLIREGSSAVEAMTVLDAIRAQQWHRFISDDLAMGVGDLAGVIGHRQVTDAYLVALGRHHDTPLVTLDRGLAALHGARVELITP